MRITIKNMLKKTMRFIEAEKGRVPLKETIKPTISGH
jgi:hypothetical protein